MNIHQGKAFDVFPFLFHGMPYLYCLVKALHLAIPIMVISLFATWMMYTSGESWSIVLVIGFISLIAIYTLKDAIDWRYYQKHPPVLEDKVKLILSQVPFYKHLDDVKKKKFELRLGLFLKSHEYRIQPTRKAQEDEDEFEAPDELAALASIPAIILTYNQDKFLCPEIDKIIFYNHPFPTPEHKILHHSEWNVEDKVLIFSVPHLRKGNIEPFTYFDLGMYEWSRVCNLKESGANWISFNHKFGINKEQVIASIGLPEPDVEAVLKVFVLHSSYLPFLS